MTNMVAVTGGTGFVGKVLVGKLLDDGFTVRLLTRRADAGKMFRAGRIEIWNGDLVDPVSLLGFVDGLDTVYHLAGEIHDSSRFWAVNVQGTSNLLDACRYAGVRRFLYLSSVGVMGVDRAVERVDETTPVRPRNAYEISKYEGESVAFRYHQDQGMHVSALRPSIIFGEEKNPRADSFFSWVRMVNARRFLLLGKDYISSYVYVGDVVAACVMVANHPRAGGQVYIVNEPIRLTTFVDEMSRILCAGKLPVLPGVIGAVVARLLRVSGRFGSLYNRTVFSTDKLSILGFELPFGYSEGLRLTITWYRQAGLLSSRSHILRE